MKTMVAGGEKSVHTFQSPWTQVMKWDTPRNKLDQDRTFLATTKPRGNKLRQMIKITRQSTAHGIRL